VLQIGSGLWIYRSGEQSELITLNNSDLTVYKATTLNNGLTVNINNTSTIATFDSANNINFYGDFYATTKSTYLGTTYLSKHSTFDNECWIYGKNQNATPEICFLPRNATNGTYLNYGEGGFYIRNNNSINAILIDNSKNTTMYGKCSAISFEATSDYRIKENVINLTNKSSFTVDNLRPVTYTNKLSGKQDIGLIAHELQEHYPFLVSGEKDGLENQSVNYIGLIGILIKEIQELKERVKTFESTQPFITK
jgi:hypothetical protein